MNTFAQEPTYNWKERLKRKLFRFVPCEAPLQARAEDYVRTTVRSELSIIDRLKVLITGKVEVEICVATEKECNVMATNAVLRTGRFSNVNYRKMLDQ